MPYEIKVPENDNDYDEDEYNSSDNRAVLIIDSPLSNDPCDACLEVEVIGIFPDNSEAMAGPTMAMVALKKRRDPNGSSGNSVTEGLFAASEKSIVQSLDRGLQDLEEGRVVVPQMDVLPDNVVDENDDEVDSAMKRMGYKNSMDAATSQSSATQSNDPKIEQGKTPKKPINIERDGLGNVIIDSVASPVTTPPSKVSPKPQQQQSKKEKTKVSEAKVIDNQPPAKSSCSCCPPETSSSSSSPPPPPKQIPQQKRQQKAPEGDEDFAIKMARKQAEALMTTVRAGKTTSSTERTVAISGGESDFAILAAKNAAAARRLKGGEAKMKKKVETKDGATKGQDTGAAASTTTSKKIQKGKVQDLSDDEMFLKLSNIAGKAKESSWKSTLPKMKNKGKGKTLESSSSSSSTSSPHSNKKIPRSDPDKEELTKMSTASEVTLKSGQKTTTTESSDNDKSDDEIRNDVMKIAQQNEQVQRELKAATDMMQIDDNEEEEGLSPEDLLKSVLKFGEEKEKEERPGHGFVEGAFGKAKELLRKEEDSSSAKGLGFKEPDESMDEIKRKAEEEELKRIFAAGQSMASNLSKPESRAGNLAKPSITEEDINELIDADDTVPRNARILDDELAELEVRMSRSEGEESGPNRVFDVFSGPEVYDPNVDPETAVNWPGAKEGTRTDVQLPTDLSTALKQARFASAVLSQMREEGSEENGDQVRYFVGTKELPLERVALLRSCVNEAVKAGIVEDPEILMLERSRLQMLVDELVSQPEERLEEIVMNYKDVLLSDNLVDLIKERLQAMTQRDLAGRREGKEDLRKEIHARERAIMINLAQIAQALVKEAQALGAELEVSMLEIIRNICEVAMDPSHTTEEDTAVALTDAVRDMRPMLDDAFVAYLKYAIAEEEGKLARSGVVDDPEHNRWLFVLKIVQEGVYAELSQGVKRYIDHILYVLRMKSKTERRELLKQLIDVMPTMDVRPFVKVVNNIVSSLGTTVKGDFTDGVILGEMTNQLLQLQRDVGELLPPERINELSKDADAWAATQRERLLERRNLTRQRIEAGRQTGDIDPDKVIKKPGVEAERFD